MLMTATGAAAESKSGDDLPSFTNHDKSEHIWTNACGISFRTATHALTRTNP